VNLGDGANEVSVTRRLCRLREDHPRDLRLLRLEVQVAQVAEKQQPRRFAPAEQRCGLVPHSLQDRRRLRDVG